MLHSRTFITMGFHVYPELIRPAISTIPDSFMNKPNGGLWASTYTPHDLYMSDWHSWCAGAEFRYYNNKPYTLFKLKSDASIFILDSLSQMEILERDYLTEPALPFLEGKFFSSFIDFNKLSKDYDGFYLSLDASVNFRLDFDHVSFASWDCESLLLFNANSIDLETIEYHTYEGDY